MNQPERLVFCLGNEMRKKKQPKHNVENLLPALRIAAEARNKIRALGVEDNGGAIHSAERIVDILGQRINYPVLSHINNLKKFADAEMSVRADQQTEGNKVEIEHVTPKRAMTILVLNFLEAPRSNAEIVDFIKTRYRLALLTPDERRKLDKENRTRDEPGRLENAGIEIRAPKAV